MIKNRVVRKKSNWKHEELELIYKKIEGLQSAQISLFKSSLFG